MEEDSSGYPLAAGCWSAEEVALFVLRFLDAFNRGDRAELARFFPDRTVSRLSAVVPGEETFFRWYSVNTRPDPSFTARDPQQLLAYFAERHAQEERLQLHRVAVAPTGAEGVTLSFRLTRQAADLAPRPVVGKAFIDRAKQVIYQWGMDDAPQ